MIRPVAVLGAVVGTLVIALGTADATAGRPHPPASALTPGSVTTVRQATVVCPEVIGGDGRGVTWVRAAGTSDVKPPKITATTVTDNAKDFAPADKSLGLLPYGTAFGGRVDDGSRALAFTATGTSAAGLAGVQVTRATGGVNRSLAATGCATPGTQFSFVGGSTQVGDELRLVLTNIDDSVASVDVNLLGPKGPVSTPGSNGLLVEPHSRLALDLAKLGPGQPHLTTLVTAVTGRVAAAVLTTHREGDIAKGEEWIPDSGPSSRRSVVPGLVSDATRQTLVLANPGADAANVSLQLVTKSGTVVPTNANALVVPPTSVFSVDVTPALKGHSGALIVTADTPVLAGVSQEFASTEAQPADISWSGQTGSLTSAAVLPVVPIDAAAKRDVFLYLSAVRGAVTVTITPTGAASGPVQVQVPAASTVTADLAKLLQVKSGNLSVTISPDGSGQPVTVSAVFREKAAQGDLVAQVGVVSVSGVIVLPSVEEDPTVAGVHPGEAPPSVEP